MTKYSTPICILISIAFFSACSSIKVEYVGGSFKPTPDVELYFEKKDIKKPYNVIGEVTLKAPTSFSPIALQNKLKKIAESKGAEGVVFLSFRVTTVLDPIVNYPTMGGARFGEGSNDPCIQPTNMGPYWGDMFTQPQQQMPQYYHNYLMKALFIRYKK